MKKVSTLLLSVLLILLMVLVAWTRGFHVSSSSMTWKVSKTDPSAHWKTIQEAIDFSETHDGDTILVYPGTYPEAVNVRKSLTIIGVGGKDSTVIDAGAIATKAVLTIWVSDVRVENFTLHHTKLSADAGIWIRSDKLALDGITIQNNEINNVDIGIHNGYETLPTYLLSDCVILRNTMDTKLGGVYLSLCNRVYVNYNTLSTTEERPQVKTGINLQDVNNTHASANRLIDFTNGIIMQGFTSTIKGNTITSVEGGQGITESGSYNLIENNTVTGNYTGIQATGNFTNIINNSVNRGRYNGISLDGYSENATGNIVTDNWAAGISSASSSNGILDNTIERVNEGIIGTAFVSGNRVVDCSVGFLISANNANVTSNIFQHCEQAVTVEADFSNMTLNTFSSCPIGIHVAIGASGNWISCNMFLNSTGADDNSNPINSWDAGAVTGGNYWSNYHGEDLDGDGFGDTAQLIKAMDSNETTNEDRYPQVIPLCPHPLFWKQEIHYVSIGGNMTLCMLEIDQNKTLVFEIIGHGWINLTIPRELLTGPFRAFVNDAETALLTSWDQDHKTTSVYFEWKKSGSANVKIEAEIRIQGDINGDGIVNIVDVSLAAKNFGKTP